MSLTLITAYTSLRVLIGVASVGYSVYANRIEDSAVKSADVGSFNFGEIPKAIFGQAIGGIFYDFLKGGTSDGYEQFLQRISASDVETLNHDLQRAARKATLLATYFACQGCLADIKSERQAIWKRLKNLAWKDEDINWLVAVSKTLKDEIKHLESLTFDDNINYQELFSIFDKDNLANPEKKQHKLAEKLRGETLNDIKNGYYSKLGGQITVPFSPNAFDLLSEAVNNGWQQFAEDESFTIQLKLTENGSAVKNYDWFRLLCVIFNEEYKVNEKVEAAINKQTALKQTALLEKINKRLKALGKIEDFENLTREVLSFKEEIFEKLDEINEGIGELKEGQSEIKNLIRQISPEKQNEPQTFVSLPELSEKIYGRNQEIAGILEFLNGDKKHGVIVAPTCFGKTYLVKKFLYRTIEISRVKPDYQNLFAKVVYLDCRTNTTFDNIVRFFATMRGETLEYRTGGKDNFLRQKVFGEIQTEKILLVFDNFESWITTTGKYVNEAVELFLRIFFNAEHQIRGFFVSQKVPINERNFLAVKKLEAISDELLEGLDEAAALELARKEGAEVGLNKVPDAELKRFFERVYYIPQAIQSMIGYLATVGVSFYVCQRDFWRDFDAEESRADDAERTLDDKLRPTRALIRLQISKQDKRPEQLLSLLAFFENPVPKEVLLLDFKAADPAAFSPESHKAVNNLFINRLAQTEIDAVKDIDYRTGIAEDIVYYRLHPFFRDIVRELFQFEIENANFLTKYADELLRKGNQAYYSNRFRKAIAFYTSAERVERYLVYEKGIEDRRNDLANTYNGKGIALDRQGKLSEAIAEFDKAIVVFERLVNKEQRNEIANDLAGTYMNKGVALLNQGKLPEATGEFEKAIEIFERLFNKEQHDNLANELAMAYMNKGIALENQGRLPEAITEYDRAIEIYERLVYEEQRSGLANDLARAYINKGIALYDQDRLPEAIAEYNRTIKIRERLVYEEQRGELANDLARSYINKGIALASQDELLEAITEYDKAIAIYERLVNEEQHRELANELAAAYTNKGVALYDQDRQPEAIVEHDRAIEIREQLINEENRSELANQLAMAYGNKANSLVSSNEFSESVKFYDLAGSLWETAISRGENHLLPEYLRLFPNRIEVLIKLEDYQRTATDVLNTFQFINLLQEPDFPDYFKQRIRSEIGNILFQINNLPVEKREEIYTHAGENGEIIRQYVDNFEKI